MQSTAACECKVAQSGASWLGLPIEHFLDVANLLLDLALGFLRPAFRLEALVSNDLARALFDAAFYFLGGSFDFIVSTVFHGGMGLWVYSFGAIAGKSATPLTVFLGGVLNALPGLFDVLAGTFHRVTGGESQHAEQNCDENGDFEWF